MKDRLSLLVLLLACMLVSVGCDDDDVDPQPQEVEVVNDVWIGNFSADPQNSDIRPERLDSWYVENSHVKNGKIFMMGFMVDVYLVNSEGKQYPQGGIAVNFKIYEVDNLDPVFQGNCDSIWHEKNDAGKPHGFMDMAYGSKKELIIDDSGDNLMTLKTRTGPNGGVRGLVSMGDPQAGTAGYIGNDDYLLPGTEKNDAFWCSRVKMEISIPNLPDGQGPISHKIHMVFRRSPGSSFSEMVGNSPAVYAWCYCGLEEAPDSYEVPAPASRSTSVVNENLRIDLKPVFDKVVLPERGQGTKYPVVVSNQKAALMKAAAASSGGFNITGRDIMQLRYYGGDAYNQPGWYYFLLDSTEGLYQIQFDPTKPQAVLDALDSANPYIFKVEAEAPINIPYDDLYGTMSFQAVKDGEVVNAMNIPISQVDKDGKTLTGFSQWWVPCNSPEMQGVYKDSWDNSWIVFYMPPGARAKITFGQAGDLNLDRKVDLKDFAVLQSNWLNELPDTDLRYVILDTGSPDDLAVDTNELLALSDRWLVDYSTWDPNDYIVDPNDVVDPNTTGPNSAQGFLDPCEDLLLPGQTGPSNSFELAMAGPAALWRKEDLYFRPERILIC